MKKHRTEKRAETSTARSKVSPATSVERAWLKFAAKFRAFKEMPDNEDDKAIKEAWEKALRLRTRRLKRS
jgi:hypothetical protein